MTALAPTIPPRVRLDVDRLPAHDVLVVLAARDRARPTTHPFDVVYDSRSRKHG